MNTSLPEKRGPGRPPKKEVEAERRRRRTAGADFHARRMGVNPDLLDFNNYKYRWLNDEPGRMHRKVVADDWDIVMNDKSGRGGEQIKDDATDLGNAVSIVVGTHPDGSRKLAYLCRKRKDFYEEDKAEKMRQLDEQQRQLRAGNDRYGNPQADYIPTAGISLG